MTAYKAKEKGSSSSSSSKRKQLATDQDKAEATSDLQRSNTWDDTREYQMLRPATLHESSFNADELFYLLLHPTVSSKEQVATQRATAAARAQAASSGQREPMVANRLDNVWVWNGRPDWEQIFKQRAETRQHRDIGVCFCGAPVVGRDLKAKCREHSSVKDDCYFTLHKENF